MTRLNRLNLWTLEERRNRADLIELVKIYWGLSGIKIESMLNTDSRTRSHSLKLKKHRSRLDLRKYFFSERVVNCWNELDEDNVSATTVNMSKKRMQRIRQLKTSFLHGHLVSPKLQGLIWRKSIFFLVRPHQVIHQVIHQLLDHGHWTTQHITNRITNFSLSSEHALHLLLPLRRLYDNLRIREHRYQCCRNGKWYTHKKSLYCILTVFSYYDCTSYVLSHIFRTFQFAFMIFVFKFLARCGFVVSQ